MSKVSRKLSERIDLNRERSVGETFLCRGSFRVIFIFLCLFFLLAFTGFSLAAGSSTDQINGSINLSETASIDIHIGWDEEASENSRLNEVNWSVILSSPQAGKLKLDLTVSATFSEMGVQWLSRQGFKRKLSLADGHSNLVEELVMEDWEGKQISDVKKANAIFDVAPEVLLNQITSLKIDEISCKRFEWNGSVLNTEITLYLTGPIVQNSESVKDPPVNMSGFLKLSKPDWVINFNSNFQVIDSNDDWTWNFEVPHIQSIYNQADYVSLKRSITKRNAELTLNSLKNMDLSKIPEDYKKRGRTYKWTGQRAIDSMAALLTGEGGYSISHFDSQAQQNQPVSGFLGALAGGPYTVMEGKKIELDGSANYNLDDEILSYSWSITKDPTGRATLKWADNKTSIFNAPYVDSDSGFAVQLKVTDDMGNTDIETTSILTLDLSENQPINNIESISPENAAELLSKSSIGDAVNTFEYLSLDTIVDILEVSENIGLSENVAKVLNLMDSSRAASAIHRCNRPVSVLITESIVQENLHRAAKIVDRGAKLELESQAEMISYLPSRKAANLLLAIFNLPETPVIAADLFGAMKTEDSAAILEEMIDMEKFEKLNTIFSHLDDNKLNDIYSELSENERGQLYYAFSPEVKSKISESLGPNIEVENINVSKPELAPGEIGSVSVTLTNNGGTPGLDVAELKVNGVIEHNRRIYLDVGKTETISFQISKQKLGSYSVEAGDQTESFQVLEKGDSFIESLKKIWILARELGSSFTTYFILLASGVVVVFGSRYLANR